MKQLTKVKTNADQTNWPYPPKIENSKIMTIHYLRDSGKKQGLNCLKIP